MLVKHRTLHDGRTVSIENVQKVLKLKTLGKIFMSHALFLGSKFQNLKNENTQNTDIINTDIINNQLIYNRYIDL